MTEPTYAQLRAHEKRITGMYTDPECVGELLLVGIAMARSIDLGDPPWPREGGGMDLKLIGQRLYGRYWLPSRILGMPEVRGDTHPRKRIRSLFYADRRRYDPNIPDEDGRLPAWKFTCQRPMVRRDGLCDRSAHNRRTLTDPLTGLRSYVAACSNSACKAWLADLTERNRAELAASPPPTPAANTGGVLERHLPEIDWWAVWRRVDKDWTPPPEGRPFEKPRLTLLVGDDDPDVPTVTARPTLHVLDGGWR